MEFVFDDGGRAEAGFKGFTGDCVCRAISIATGTPYKEVYDLINEYAKREKSSKQRKYRTSKARTGVFKDTIKKIMKEHFRWEWIPVMKVGSGCTMHLKADELPEGTIIVNLSRHLACVKDGVLHDTYDCSRGGTRCVYGYWRRPHQ